MDDPSSPSSPDAADARWPDGNSDVEGAEERIQSLMIQRALLGADALGSNYQQYSRTTGGGGQRSDERPTSREPMDPYRNAKLFFSLFLFRSLNGLFVNTWFDPDETWQSLEVAHQTVFGVGYMTWYFVYERIHRTCCTVSYLIASIASIISVGNGKLGFEELRIR